MRKMHLKPNKIKKYFFFIFIILTFFFSYQFLDNKFNKKFSNWLDDRVWNRLDAAKRILIYNKSFTDRFYNSYNQKYLPETLFLNIDYKIKKLNFLTKRNTESYNYSFFIEIIDDQKILVTDFYGNFNLVSNIFNNDKIKPNNVKLIESNLSTYQTLDTFLFKDKIFISYISLKDDCKTFKISYAKFDTEYLNFTNFYKNEDCRVSFSGGRMQAYKFKNKEGLIFSLTSAKYNHPTNEPQDKNSVFGKILFQDFDLSKPIVFSKGHRVNQGLVTVEDVILVTEHGPKGGDEINKIEYSENYGWPISSYGVKYGKNIKKPYYEISHSKLGFKEPLYAYLPAIGISEIIKLPNSFSDFWQNNFIVTSLNRGSIFRVKFDENFTKLLFSEEVYIGKRIRDIKYIPHNKKIILALETRGEIGILSTDD